MLGTVGELPGLPPADLAAIIRRLDQRVKERDRRIVRLEKQLGDYEEPLRESKLSERAQSGKGRRVAKPKKPDRKPGEGCFERRQESPCGRRWPRARGATPI